MLNLQEEILREFGGRQLLNTGMNNLDMWLDIYRGESYWIKGDNLKSLNLGTLIPSELAKPATIEFKSNLSTDNAAMIKAYETVKDELRTTAEYGLALGGIIIKPYPVGDSVAIDIVTPDNFVPLEVDSFGRIKKIAFIDRIARSERKEIVYFTRIEIHERVAEQYIVINKCYKSTYEHQLGKEISIDLVGEWNDIEESAVYEIDYNLYGYFKNPQANNLDLKSSLGISCFAKAISMMQDADEQYNRIMWEYEAKEVAIDVDETMIREGTLPVGRERLFRKLSANEDDMYHVYSPDIRDSSLFNGLNQILKKIEDLTQLSRGTLSDIEYSEKTAAEIKMSKQRLYSAVVDIQKNLQATLENVLQAIAFWLDVDEYTASYEWDDSVIVDTETEQKIRLNEVAAGLIKPEIYLKWRYGVDEEAAKEIMPDIMEGETDATSRDLFE